MNLKIRSIACLPYRGISALSMGVMALVAAACGITAARADTASDESPALSDIVVTAQRRKETLQEAPISVTVVSGEMTKDLDIRDLNTVQFVSPSMSFSQQDGFAQVFIRGIGANYAEPGLENPIAIYQDDAYQTGANTSVLQALDTQGIQVLNGPQGTLYGRNASGGVILVNTNDPTNESLAQIDAEYGRFNHEQVDLVLNTPVNDDLRVRVAARYLNDDGYIHNEFDGKTLGGGQTYTVRGKVAWTPSAIPGLSVGWETEYTTSYLHHDYSQERLQTPLCLGCALGATPPSGFYDTNQNGDFAFQSQSLLNILHATYEFDDYSLKSVTAYHYSTFGAPHGSDQDYTTVDLFRLTDYEPGRTYSEDLTVQSKYTGPLNFIGGVTYIRDDREFRATFDGLAFAPLETGPNANGSPSNLSYVRTNSVSGFLEGSYKIIDGLTFTAGGRYNIDRRVLEASNNTLADEVFGNPGFSQEVEFHSFTPRFVLQYMTPIGNLYVSDTKGFKAGGLNTPAFTENPIINPERIRSYEAGLKSVWMDNRLQTNLDVFQYKVSDLQVSVTDVLAGGVVIENAASAKGTGTEFTARYAATRDLTLGAGGNYLHARFESYDNAAQYCGSPTGLVGCTANLTGTPLARAPEFTGYLTAEYGFVPFSGYKATLALLGHWTDDFLFFPGGGGSLGIDKQSAYWLVNINAWLAPVDARWRVGLYVDNATATKYFDFATTAAPYGAYYQAAPPLTAGVKFEYKFGGN